MACSRFEYVKSFERHDALLPSCWVVLRVDGKGFTKFAAAHGFEKPNDARALAVMNDAAVAVLDALPDVVLAYGQSDEYSFVLKKDSTLYGRREAKLVSVLTSLFTSAYVLAWSRRMGEGTPLRQAPCFDGRAVAYPSDAILRDYLAWRQVDAHINNQYNTVFWALVAQGGETPAAAQTLIRGTDAAWKNETLHTRFSINYNDLPAMFRKGSVVTRVRQSVVVKVKEESGEEVRRERCVAQVTHEDIIGDKFYAQRPELGISCDGKQRRR